VAAPAQDRARTNRRRLNVVPAAQVAPIGPKPVKLSLWLSIYSDG
jgi:hypothetical protein